VWLKRCRDHNASLGKKEVVERVEQRLRDLDLQAPMTLGQALAAKVRIIAWYKSCGHRAEPAVADQVERYGTDTTVID
jgi:hypothetical protein